MKLSSRNQIKGKIVDIVKGPVMAKIKIDIGGGNSLTSVITEAMPECPAACRAGVSLGMPQTKCI